MLQAADKSVTCILRKAAVSFSGRQRGQRGSTDMEHEDVLHSCAKLLLEKEKVHREEFEALFTTEKTETENTDI